MDLKALYESSALSPPKPFYLPRKEDPNGNKSKSYLYLEKPKYIDINDRPLKSNNKDEKKNDDQMDSVRASRLRLSLSSVGYGSAQNSAVAMLQNVKKRNAERRAKLLEKTKENEIITTSSQNIVNISQNSSQLKNDNTKIFLNNDNELIAIGLRNIKESMNKDDSMKRITSPIAVSTSNNIFNENNGNIKEYNLSSFKSTISRPSTASNCYPSRDRDFSSNINNISKDSSILNARTQEDRYNTNNSNNTNISLNLSDGLVSTQRPKSAASIRKSTTKVISNKQYSDSDNDAPNPKELNYIKRQEEWLQKKQNNIYTLKKEIELEKANKEPIIPILSSNAHDSWEKAKKKHALELEKQMKAEEIREKEKNLFLYPYKPKLVEVNLQTTKTSKILKKKKKKKRISKLSYNNNNNDTDDMLEETALNIGFSGLGYYDEANLTGITAISGKQKSSTSKKYGKYDIDDEDVNEDDDNDYNDDNNLNKHVSTGVRIGTIYGHTQNQRDNQRDLIRDQIRDKLRDKQRDEELYKNEIKKNNKIDLKSDSLDLIFNNTPNKKIIKIEPIQERTEIKSSSNNLIRRSASAGNSNRFKNLFDDYSNSNIEQSKPIQRGSSAPSTRLTTTPSPHKKLKDIIKSPLTPLSSLNNDNETKITAYKSSLNNDELSLNKNNLKESKHNYNILGNNGKNNKNNEGNYLSNNKKKLSSEELGDEENRLWLASIMKQRQDKKSKEDSLELAMAKRRKIEEERVQKKLIEFEKICIEKKKKKELDKQKNLPLSSQYRNNIQSNDFDDLYVSDTDSGNDDDDNDDKKDSISSQYSSIYSPTPKSTTNTFNHSNQTSPILQNNSANSLNSPNSSPYKNNIIASPKTMISSPSIIKVISPTNTNLRLSSSKSPTRSPTNSTPRSKSRSTSKSTNNYNSPSSTTSNKNIINSPTLTDSAVKALVARPFTTIEDFITNDNNHWNSSHVDDLNRTNLSEGELYAIKDMTFSTLHLSPFSLELNDHQRQEEEVDNNITKNITTISSPVPIAITSPTSISNKLPTSTEKLKDKFLPHSFFEISSTESKGRYRVNDARDFETDSMYRKTDLLHEGVTLLFGIHRASKETKIITILFDRDLFTESEAKTWWICNQDRLQI